MVDRSDDQPGWGARYDEVLDAANAHARAWLSGVSGRAVPPMLGSQEVADRLGRTLPDDGEPAAEVIERLVAAIEPGLIATGSPRFYGWVIGGTQPVALAADWLVSTWDQNAGAAHDHAGRGRRRGARGGVAGRPARTARRQRGRLHDRRHDGAVHVHGRGARRRCCAAPAGMSRRRACRAAPRIRFIVGEERHGTVDLAGRYLGLGSPTIVPSDEQGRIRVDELRTTLAAGDGPAIVLLQAGNIHSGAFDDFAGAIARRARGAMRGCMSTARSACGPPRRRAAPPDGRHGRAPTPGRPTRTRPSACPTTAASRSCATRRRCTARSACSASYLQATDVGADPHEKVPELSRRARGVPTWAVLRSLGRTGVARLVERLADAARGIADGVGALPGRRGAQRRRVHPGVHRAGRRRRRPRRSASACGARARCSR